ncbi:DUF4383 domain-containing protein [Allokutzneria sp. A3M-2-11 16]|uniref:DUF4383 domain-containing protein n=1 Tax=Allokutzneria sp. A3M-2-11 16 TaxID=2962043 RepID=UPI0020B87B60|nr:DUF4383 domain-containing protein [Allokutzneria sp. A3M-2-11 16]MCP3804393.1 DUF4383 domain-containing protein [Allokutzneria sp. A3M-2-11 16]
MPQRVLAGSRTPVQWAAGVVAATFLFLGIFGLVPGLTTDYALLKMAGPRSGAELFGVFDVSVLHNVVHLLFGAAGLTLGNTGKGARLFLAVGAGVALALGLYGFLVPQDSTANVLPTDAAGTWLHVGLAAVMAVLALCWRVPEKSTRAGEPLRRKEELPSSR